MGALTAKSLKEMMDVDFRAVDVNDLVELTAVKVDKRQAKADRMYSFIQQVHNPFCYRIGTVAIKASYIDTTDTLEDKLIRLAQTK